MANELANTAKTTMLETASAAPLQHLMVSELSPVPTSTSIDSQKAIESSITPSGANKSIESSSQGVDSLPSNLLLAAVDKLQKDVSAIPAVATTDSAESAELTRELKTAVNNSTNVVVRMPPCNTTRGDIVIKRDGTIVHYLDFNSQKDDAGSLVVALEQGSGTDSGLSSKQTQTLKNLIDYSNAKNKDFSVEFPETLSKETAWPSMQRTASKETRNGSNDSKAHFQSLPGFHPPARDYAVANNSSAPSQSRPGETQARTRTTDNTAYIPPAIREWTQLNLFELLMDWFGSDPETFQKLMPGIYKKVAGANGKIDPAKLRMLLESKDPSLNTLRNQLPQLAEAFPSAKHSSGNHVSSSDNAVNKTGARLADKAAQVSEELGSSGYCAKGVSFAIERATGKVIWGNANDMREILPDQGFTVSQSKELKVGQVVHVFWTPEVYAQEQARRGPCPNYGDIAIIGKGRDGQLYAYNDAATPLNNYLQKSRYDWSTLKVFNPPSV